MANSEIIGAGQDTAHRAPKINTITCGDCLEVMQAIPDKSVDMILCDLPYGITACKWDTIIPFSSLWDSYNRIAKENSPTILFSCQPFTTSLINSNPHNFRYDLIWCKNMPVGAFNSGRMPMRSHEIILVFYRKLPTYNPIKTKRTEKELSRFMRSPIKTTVQDSVYGDFDRTVLGRDATERNPDSLLFCDVVNGRNGAKVAHPTQKPVALFEYLIRTYTNEGCTVLDNCIGSGTTAIACINTNRNFIGIEKEEKYCRIAEERIHALRSPAQDTMEICHTARNSASLKAAQVTMEFE